MLFEQAVKELRLGAKLKRKDWSVGYDYIQLIPVFDGNKLLGSEIWLFMDEIKFLWKPSQDDILYGAWEVLEIE